LTWGTSLVSEEKNGAERGAFLDAIESLIRPLVPVVLSYGVTAQDIGEVFKSLYLETLAEKLREQGRPATVARLALMTGLTRGEVERLRALRGEKQQLRASSTQKLDQLARLLATWHDDSRFSTPYGAPLDLSLQPERGFRTFAEIVETAGAGNDPSLVLDELLAAGCVEVHAEKFVRCINRVYIPTGVDVSRIVRLGQYVAAMNATMAYNLLRSPSDPSYYERALVTGGTVSKGFRDVALQYLNTTLQQFIEQMDRWWESTEEKFQDPKGSRYGVCAFFYEEQPQESEADGRQIANQR
jgi:hypothetical protein